MKRLLKRVLTGLAILVMLAFIAIQFVPVERTNPPATAPLKDPPQVLAVLRQSCYDCHSNETRWPWYSQIAPVSWLVAKDAREGRERLNFSHWENYSAEELSALTAEIAEQTQKGGMPLPIYLLMHPQAKLKPEDLSIIKEWTNTLSPGAESDDSDSHGKTEESETES